jgi:hypothetical protein
MPPKIGYGKSRKAMKKATTAANSTKKATKKKRSY